LFGLENGVDIVELDRDHLALEELDQLAVGEIVGLDHGDLVAARHRGGDRKEERALRAGGDDHAVGGVDRRAGEGGEAGGDQLADADVAAIFGIGLRAAERDAGREQLEGAGRRLMGVDVAMREIDRAAGDGVAAQQGLDLGRLLADFLAGGVVRTQLLEFGFDRHG
jgi:hypothetical protein